MQRPAIVALFCLFFFVGASATENTADQSAKHLRSRLYSTNMMCSQSTILDDGTISSNGDKACTDGQACGRTTWKCVTRSKWCSEAQVAKSESFTNQDCIDGKLCGMMPDTTGPGAAGMTATAYACT